MFRRDVLFTSSEQEISELGYRLFIYISNFIEFHSTSNNSTI